MATRLYGIEMPDFQSMAAAWPELRDTTARGVVQFTGAADDFGLMAALADISQHRATWELATTAAAYSLLKPPAVLNQRSGSDLSVVAQALNAASRWDLLPGFGDIALEVSSLDLSRLVRTAPRLESLARQHRVLTAENFAMASFCLRRYGDDPVNYLRCVRGEI